MWARTVEVIITEVGTRLYPGLSEIDIWGDGVPTLFRPRLKWNDDTLGNHAGPSAADLDGDGVSEVVVTRGGNRLHVYDGATGELKWFHTAAQTASQTAALGDVADCIDGAPAACRDEDLEVVYVGNATDWLRIADARGNLISELDTGTSMSRSEEHTSELQSLMRISYAVFCLKKKKTTTKKTHT